MGIPFGTFSPTHIYWLSTSEVGWVRFKHSFCFSTFFWWNKNRTYGEPLLSVWSWNGEWWGFQLGVYSLWRFSFWTKHMYNIDIGCRVFFCCGKQTTFSYICPTKVDQGLLIFWMLLFNLFAWRPGDFPNFIVWVMRSESAMGILHDVWCGVCEAFQGQKNRTLTLADEIHREVYKSSICVYGYGMLRIKIIHLRDKWEIFRFVLELVFS